MSANVTASPTIYVRVFRWPSRTPRAALTASFAASSFYGAPGSSIRGQVGRNTRGGDWAVRPTAARAIQHPAARQVPQLMDCFRRQMA